MKQRGRPEVRQVKNALEAEDNEKLLDQDTFRRRLGHLKLITKDLTFKAGNVILRSNVKGECPDATPEDILTCLSIANSLKKFVPEKKNYHILAYQLYFYIFVNALIHRLFQAYL